MTNPFTLKPGPTSDDVVVVDTHAGALLRVGQGAARIARSDLPLLIRRLAESHGGLAVIDLPQSPHLSDVEAFTNSRGETCVRFRLFQHELSQAGAYELAGAIVACAQQPPDPDAVERAELATVISEAAYGNALSDPLMVAHAGEVADAVLAYQRSKQQA